MGIKKILIERNESNRGTNRLPPVLPNELARMTRAAFNELIVLQRPRLRGFYDEEELISLQQEFGDSLSQLRREFKEMILGLDGLDFENAWNLIRKRYPLMSQFFGRLTSVYPGTSTVESDFLSLDLKKTDIVNHAPIFHLKEYCNANSLSYWQDHRQR